MVAEMGGLVEKQIADSVDALAKRDVERAARVVAADAGIDALQREIEDKAVLTIARRQPMAVDLREIVGALRLANDLERVGDLAKNIAKRVARSPATSIRKSCCAASSTWRRWCWASSSRCSTATRARPQQGAGGVEGRRRDRRHVHLVVPRALDLHDGGPAQHHLLHPSHVLRQEHRAHGRSRHQHRRDGAFHDRRPGDLGRAPEGRHHRRSSRPRGSNRSRSG